MKRRPSTQATDRARARFIEVLRETCNVSDAARAANIERSTPYKWRDADPDFFAQWVEAEEYAADRLEREAWRRAVEGIDKPVIHLGVITDTFKEYSDRMLEILLKGHRPNKFKERVQNEHTGKDGASLAEEAATAAEMITKRLDALAAAK